MATQFKELPILDLTAISGETSDVVNDQIRQLAGRVRHVFETVGFAYIVNHGVSQTHRDIEQMARDFFSLDIGARMSVAKKTFVPTNANTYHGYFPIQEGDDSFKEGFELGPSEGEIGNEQGKKFDLLEANVWPTGCDELKARMKSYYEECLALGARFMRLLAISFGLEAQHFRPFFDRSISTLRFLHYPKRNTQSNLLSCAAHTDSGIVTILYQDRTGGLEVLNSLGEWVPAPYVPESYVVNLGDLMSRWTRGRLLATQHRVRSVTGDRYSVPFFFEPNFDSLIEPLPIEVPANKTEQDSFEAVKYGEYLVKKMSTWVEYQDV